MNEADRFFGRSATRAGNAGDGDTHPRIRIGECAQCHGARGLLRNGTMRRQGFGGNTEHLHFGFVRIGNESPVHDIGRSGDFGQRPGDQAAGAAFRRCRFPAERPAAFKYRGCKVARLIIEIVHRLAPLRDNAGWRKAPGQRKSRRTGRRA